MDVDVIIKKHQNKVLMHVSRLVPEVDAEDVMQEALIGAWQGYSRFKAEASVESWLWRITHNKIVDYYRNRQRYADVLGQVEGSRFAKPVYNDFEVYDLLQRLPKTYRDILWKRYVEKFSISEIEENEGMSYDTVKGRSRRGIEYIRRHDLAR